MAYDEGAGAPPAESETPTVDPTQPEPPIGVFQKPDEEIVKQIRLWFRESADASGDTRRKRREDWQMLDGDQWDEAAKKLMTAGGRPALTLNQLTTIIFAVEGEERSNRQEIKLYGEGQEDDGAAYGLNRLLKWIDHQCGGQFALSGMFRNGIASGEGWVVPEVDFFDDPEGKIKLEYVDDEECFDDPLNTCPVSSKSRYFHRVRMMSEDELEARWPGACQKLRQCAYANEAGPETDGKGYRDIYLAPDDTKSPKIYDAQKKLWAVLETWWYQIEPGWIVVDDATGMLVEKSDVELQAMKDQRQQEQMSYLQDLLSGRIAAQAAAAAPPAAVPAAVPDPANPAGAPASGPIPVPSMPQPIQAIQRPVKCIYQAFTSYDVLLEKKRSPLKELKRMPYVPFRAIWQKSRKEWKGLIRDLIDAQRQHNVEQSVIVQLMQLMPKAAWMAPKGSFHNKQEWQEKMAKPGAMLEYNASRGKPEQIETPAIPRHLIDMALTRPQAMREISGVNIEMTGQRQGSDPGVVFELRKKAAATVMAPIFDNYRQSKMEIGKVLLSYIQTYVSKGRRIRVLGPEGATYVEMTEQMQLARYDLAIDEENASINDRLATLNIMQTTLPQMMKAGVPIPPEFIDLLPMPPHIRDAWKRMVVWELTLANKLPPPGWQPGMPIPLASPPTGAPLAIAAPAAPPPAAPVQ
jgi:hypothetical protein